MREKKRETTKKDNNYKYKRLYKHVHSLSQLTTAFVCIKQLDSNKSNDKTYNMQLKGGYQNTATD